jgi:hypothetical protein
VQHFMTTPRHILLVGNYPPDGEESMHRYASLLARHLPGLGFKITLLSPSVFFGRLSCGSKAMAKFLGYLDKLILFPSQLRRAVIRVARECILCGPATASARSASMSGDLS